MTYLTSGKQQNTNRGHKEHFFYGSNFDILHMLSSDFTLKSKQFLKKTNVFKKYDQQNYSSFLQFGLWKLLINSENDQQLSI
jgi:hypothetical protein